VTKLLTLLYVVIVLQVDGVHAYEDSLQESYGKSRVKIQRADAPKDVSRTKLQGARARYEAQMRICKGETDRARQYCRQQAENQLMIDERRARQQASEDS